MAIAVGFMLPSWGYTQPLPNPRRISDTASDARDLERSATADQIPLKTRPSELDRDRAHSLALYGQARLLYQRGQAAQALEAYQRAYHWFPDSTNAAEEVIPLAFFLKRPGLATRYALIVAEKGPPNPDLMRQVALHLIQEEKYDRAARLYQRTVQARQPWSAEWVITHLELGRMHFLLEKFTPSAESFAIVSDALDNPEQFQLTDDVVKELLGKPYLTYGLFGEAFLEADRLERAERMFRQAEEEKSNRPLFAYHQARLAKKRGQNELAIRKLTEYLESGSGDAGSEAYGLLQQLLPEAENKSDNWRTRLEELHQAHPRPVLASFLAEHYEQSGDTSRALQLFQQLHEAQPSAYTGQAILRTAKLEQDAAAILDILGNLVDQTGSIELLDVDGLLLKEDHQQLVAKVLTIAQNLISNPQPPSAAGRLFGAGLLAAKNKEFDLADRLISTGLKQADKAVQPAWEFSAALEMFMADAADRAAARFQELAENGKAKDPSTVEFYWATSLELADKTEQANKIIDQAIARTPDSALLHTRKAWIAYHAQQNKQAQQLYQQFLEKFGNDYSNQGIRELVKEAKMSMSNLLLLRKDIEGAIEWLQQILDEYPEDVGAMNDLGYLLADENRHLQRALRMVRFAVANEPENEAYLDSLGWALFRLQEYDEAAKFLRQAASGEEPDGIILEHLGDVYDKMDQSDKAKAAWQRAAQALAKAKHKDTERIAIIQEKIAGLEE